MEGAFIGIDLGGSFIKGVLTDSNGEVLARVRTATEREKGIDHVLGRIAGLVDSLTQQRSQVETGGRCAVQGVGIGVPGMLDALRHRVILAPNLEWREIPLKQRLEKQLGIPVFLENDANVAALGEAWLGAGRDKSCFLLITIGTGIGSGLILDGKLFTGTHGLATEMGHMTVVPGGPVCACGGAGCLETLISAPAILKGALEEQVVSEGADARQVLDLANRGHEGAALVVGQALEYLAIGLKNSLVLLDLDLILIGGGVGDSLGSFMEVLSQKTLDLLPVKRKVTIKGASLGNQAGALGAARLAILMKEQMK